MSAAFAEEIALLSAEEFVQKFGGQRVELRAGQVVELPMPTMKHGKVCYRTTLALGNFVEAHQLGHVMTNDSWFVVEREPDTVRGPDVCFFSYQRLPKGPVPEGLLTVVPELVIEVRSPSDLWTEMLAKMLEYLAAGVLVVVILDPKTSSASVFRSNERQEIYESTQQLLLPDILPGFAVSVQLLFT